MRGKPCFFECGFDILNPVQCRVECQEEWSERRSHDLS
jgi:hypothetical protein